MLQALEQPGSIGAGRGPRALARLGVVCAGLLLAGGCATVKPAFSDRQESRSCWAAIAAAEGDASALEAEINRRIEGFQSAAEQLLAAREESILATRRALDQAPAGQPLPPAVMEELRSSIQRGIAAMEPVDRLVFGNLCWLQADGPGAAARRVDPPPLEIRVKGVALSLAGMLLLYDTYAVTGAIMSEDDRIRIFLDAGDIGYGMPRDQFHEVTRSMMSMRNLGFVQEEIAFYDAHRSEINEAAERDKPLSYLMMLIEQSPSLAYLRQVEPGETWGRRLESASDRLADNVRRVGQAMTGGLSRVVGNTAGVFETRSGWLAGDATVHASIQKALRPGDILVENTPFRLTDKLIPGYFGHVAIWLGTETQLRELGILDDPIAAAHREALKKGRTVLEALRSGVELNTLEHFLNVDDLLVLRDPQLQGDRLREHLFRALRQVGKPYDFNFDVQTSDRIACSELVFVVYTDIPWETHRRLGRYIISPDRVVDNALSHGGLEIVLLYLGGEAFWGEPAAELRERMAPPGTRSTAR